jgi:L-aspartate oxidase
VTTHEADVIVVGAGAAGLTAALGLRGRRVHLLTKGRLGASGASPKAQGGIAAALGADDSPERHAADTLAVGGGLGDAELVGVLTREGPAAVRRLVELGGDFDRGADGDFALGREAAHSRRRILHARDATGAELVRTLTAALREAEHVRVFEQAFAAELVPDGGRIVGLRARQPDSAERVHLARAVVLATGGIGHLYAHTTNPPEATGDGLALAARAGARLVDLEFVQFHPTALRVGADPMPLVTEALRGHGAHVVDEDGRRFLFDFDPAGEMAARDVVARAIATHVLAGGRAFVDARDAVGDEFPRAFPTVFELCRAHGLDPRREPIPVAPAAHYHMGGLAVDAWGRTSLRGLWACGEVASTGVHGANRLASNSLLEALVFGARVAQDLERGLPAPPPARVRPAGSLPGADVEAAAVVAALRALMWRDVGLLRDARGLERALAEIERLARACPAGALAGEARNMLGVARLITHAALTRRESRGSHFRHDHPQADPRFARRLFFAGETAESEAETLEAVS